MRRQYPNEHALVLLGVVIESKVAIKKGANYSSFFIVR